MKGILDNLVRNPGLDDIQALWWLISNIFVVWFTALPFGVRHHINRLSFRRDAWEQTDRIMQTNAHSLRDTPIGEGVFNDSMGPFLAEETLFLNQSNQTFFARIMSNG